MSNAGRNVNRHRLHFSSSEFYSRPTLTHKNSFYSSITYGQENLPVVRSLYKLLPHLDFFCKKPHTLSILDACYLYNVVGDTKIRKGEGMQLNELVRNMFTKESNTCIQPFELGVLREAFALGGTASVDSSPSEKCSRRTARKRKSESKDEH